MEFSVIVQLVLLGLVRGTMYAVMGVGLSVIFGIMGIVNFAHGELFMIGCYIMYFATGMLKLPFPVGIAAAAALMFIVGMLLEKGLVSKLREKSGREWLMNSFVLTIGLMVIFQNLALITFGSRQRGIISLIPGIIELGDVILINDHLLIIALSAASVGALYYFTKKTRTGKGIRATSQHAEAALTLGININRMFTISFGIGAVLAGIAGALLITLFPANPYAGSQPVLKSFVVVVLGGLGNVNGAIIAGLMIGLIETFSMFFLAGGWQNVLVFGVVIAVLIFKPDGLFAKAGERP